MEINQRFSSNFTVFSETKNGITFVVINHLFPTWATIKSVIVNNPRLCGILTGIGGIIVLSLFGRKLSAKLHLTKSKHRHIQNNKEGENAVIKPEENQVDSNEEIVKSDTGTLEERSKILNSYSEPINSLNPKEDSNGNDDSSFQYWQYFI